MSDAGVASAHALVGQLGLDARHVVGRIAGTVGLPHPLEQHHVGLRARACRAVQAVASSRCAKHPASCARRTH